MSKINTFQQHLLDNSDIVCSRALYDQLRIAAFLIKANGKFTTGNTYVMNVFREHNFLIEDNNMTDNCKCYSFTIKE
jgi:hypothetical protein